MLLSILAMKEFKDLQQGVQKLGHFFPNLAQDVDCNVYRTTSRNFYKINATPSILLFFNLIFSGPTSIALVHFYFFFYFFLLSFLSDIAKSSHKTQIVYRNTRNKKKMNTFKITILKLLFFSGPTRIALVHIFLLFFFCSCLWLFSGENILHKKNLIFFHKIIFFFTIFF